MSATSCSPLQQLPVSVLCLWASAVVCCRGVKGGGSLFDKADPYVKVKYGGQTEKTRTDKGEHGGYWAIFPGQVTGTSSSSPFWLADMKSLVCTDLSPFAAALESLPSSSLIV